MARTLGGQLSAGEDYQELQASVGLHLLDFDLFKDRVNPLRVLHKLLEALHTYAGQTWIGITAATRSPAGWFVTVACMILHLHPLS